MVSISMKEQQLLGLIKNIGYGRIFAVVIDDDEAPRTTEKLTPQEKHLITLLREEVPEAKEIVVHDGKPQYVITDGFNAELNVSYEKRYKITS